MTKSTVRNFIIALVTLIVSFVLLGGVLFEIERKTHVLQGQLTSIEAENKRESDFYTLEKQAKESVEQRQAVQSYFLPKSSDSIDFLNRVEQLAPQSGVSLETDALEESVDKKTKQKYIEAQFSFSGTKTAVEQFIEILEALPYVAHITGVSLGKQPGGVWEARVTMRVFILNHEV